MNIIKKANVRIVTTLQAALFVAIWSYLSYYKWDDTVLGIVMIILSIINSFLGVIMVIRSYLENRKVAFYMEAIGLTVVPWFTIFILNKYITGTVAFVTT